MAQTPFNEVRQPLSSGIGWEWGVTSNFVKIPQPLMGFYWNLPADAPCVFSKKRAKRCLGRGTAHPRRKIAWDDGQVRRYAVALRAQHGSKTQEVVRPETWEDMYQYFDTIELWHRGAWNLWRVLQLICDENEAAIAKDRLDVAVFNEVDDWAYDWCTHYENRRRLSMWDPSFDILQVLTQADHEKIHGCSQEALNVLRGALKHWYRVYQLPPPAQDTQASRAVRLGYEDMAEGRPSRPRARDDNDISLSGEAAAALAHSRPRRRSNSLPPPAIETSTADTSDFVYSANSTVVIANGTIPVKTQRPPHGLGSAAGATDEPSRKSHHVSKSGPVRAGPAGISAASRGIGVENSGPSRLPSRSQQPIVPATGAAGHQTIVRGKVSGDESQQRSATHNTFNHHSPTGSPVARNVTRALIGSRPDLCRNSNVPLDFMASFSACPCPRCSRMSRSVHVYAIPREEGVDTSQIAESLVQYFSQWGHVEGCNLKHTNARTRYAYVTYTSDDSAVRALTATRGQAIQAPHLHGARIAYPYYSKHHRSSYHWPGNHRSHSVTDTENPSAGGSGSSLSVGSPDARQPCEQPSTPLQHQNGGHKTPHLSPSSSSTLRRTPPRHRNQQMPARKPTVAGGGRTTSMMHQAPPLYPVSPYQNWGALYKHYHQGNPPFTPRVLASVMSYGQHSHGPFGPPLHTGWPDMSRPPGPMPCSPRPLPGTGAHYHGAGFERAGPQRFSAPPEQFKTNGPQPHWLPSSSETSVQTKPPSEEAAFDDQPSPTQSAASRGNSTTGSMSIRVRLPGTRTPEPAEPVVTIPNHTRVKMGSPVWRITFRDIVPPRTASPVRTSERAEPAVSAPQHETNGHQAAHNLLMAAQAFETDRHGRLEHAPSQQFTNGSYGFNQVSGTAANGEFNPSGAGFEWQLPQSWVLRNPGDVRLDADYNGTVIRRRGFGQNRQLPWIEDNGSSGSWDRAQASYTNIPSQQVEHRPFWQPPNEVLQPFNNPSHPPSHEQHTPFPDNSIQQPPFSIQGAQSDSLQQLDHPGPSRPQGKKKKKNKNKNRSAVGSQTQFRPSTPLPDAATGNGTQQTAGQAMPPPSGLANGATETQKGQLVIRPSTPVSTEKQDMRVPWDDIYNATPRKDKGKGKVLDAPSQEEAANGQASVPHSNNIQNGAGSSTMALFRSVISQDDSEQENGTTVDASNAAPNKKDKGKGKASGGGKPADSGSGHGQAYTSSRGGDKDDNTDTEKGVMAEQAEKPNEGCDEGDGDSKVGKVEMFVNGAKRGKGAPKAIEGEKTGGGVNGVDRGVKPEGSKFSVERNGGSLHISRQRVVRSKGQRMDVRDLFKDHE